MNIAAGTPGVLTWKPVRGRNPATGAAVYTGCVYGQQVLDEDGLVDYALSRGFFRGKEYDYRSLIRGLYQAITDAVKNGKAVKIEPYFVMRLRLMGAIDPATRALGEDNYLKLGARPLSGLKFNLSDFRMASRGGEQSVPVISFITSLDQYFNRLGILSRYEPWVELAGTGLISGLYTPVSVTVGDHVYPMRRTRDTDNSKSCKCFCWGGAIPWSDVPEGTKVRFTFTGNAGRNYPDILAVSAEVTVAGRPPNS